MKLFNLKFSQGINFFFLRWKLKSLTWNYSFPLNLWVMECLKIATINNHKEWAEMIIRVIIMLFNRGENWRLLINLKGESSLHCLSFMCACAPFDRNVWHDMIIRILNLARSWFTACRLIASDDGDVNDDCCQLN